MNGLAVKGQRLAQLIGLLRTCILLAPLAPALLLGSGRRMTYLVVGVPLLSLAVLLGYGYQA